VTLTFLSFLPAPLLSPLSLSLVAEAPNDSDHKTIIADPLLHLLDQQLQGVHSSLLVCKWPVALMSCFFVTLLCWDMAGDKGGWSQALWVPIVGVAMALLIWVWDRVWVTGAAHGYGGWSRHVSSLFPSCSSPLRGNDHHPSSATSTSSPDNVHSLQLVRSSLHQSDLLDREGEAMENQSHR
jgi:hypothetical protein